jgi:curved DNA-binding protein
LITVRVASHPCYQRRGNDLIVTVPVTLAEAALGAKVDVPTPKGVITLTVPPGSSSGRRLRVKGHGVTVNKGENGDLFAELRIVLPKQLDDAALEQIRDLDRQYPLQPRTELQW